jgi:SAM-dependent methyltransferase
MSNAEMIRFWNDSAGPVWTTHEEKLDAQLAPLGARTRARAALRPGERILEVGCGCGATTLELAEAVGPGGRVVAVDVSQPMLDRARERAARAGLGDRVAFRLDDAQTATLEPAAYDVLFSRFGVMFFADPVAAFANLHGALAPGGRLAFVCWQAREKNPWMIAPAVAAARHMPFPPPPPPDAPGPMAFADPDRVRTILARAGFGDVALESVEGPLRFGGKNVDEALELAFSVGPLGAAIREAKPTPAQQARVLAAVREVLEGFVTPNGVEAASAVWIVTARA